MVHPHIVHLPLGALLMTCNDVRHVWHRWLPFFTHANVFLFFIGIVASTIAAAEMGG